jgi:oxygen tolerance protein BatD
MNLKIVITLVLLLFFQFLHAEVMVSVDRNPVIADESFQMIFKTNQKVVGEPDFSPLNKSFTILNSGRRSNTQIINGEIKSSQQWVLTVIPKKAGIIGIPSIRFGNEISKPRTIKVVANASATKGNATDDIFIEVEVNTKSPYVQAQVIYTAKLYRSVQTNNASLSEPEISGGQAVINKLDEDNSFETRIKGKRYIVIERKYVIFPQSSGALTIEPLIFQGQTGSGSFFGFDPFGPQPKSIVKRSESIKLDVKPIPESFTGDTWLPASQLNIHEQWSVDPAKLQQGEATTRTLILTAHGLVASNLPETKSNLPDKLKLYPDQPEFVETKDENGSIGIRHDKMAIIPIEAGDYVLPVIKIAWWNTDTDKMEFAELPERTIHANISATSAVNETHEQVVEEITSNEKEIDEAGVKVGEPINSQTQWKWLSLILFILWVITLFVFWKSKRKTIMEDDNSVAELSRRQYLKQLKQACIANDAAMAKQSLLDWAKIMWPEKNITSIDAVKTMCVEDLQLKIDELNACLYGKEHGKWNGAEFLKSFDLQIFDNKQSDQPKGNLEPLYRSLSPNK